MPMSSKAEELLQRLDALLKRIAGNVRVEPDADAAGPDSYVLRVPPGERSPFFHPAAYEDISTVLVSFGVLIPRQTKAGTMQPEWVDRAPETVGFRISAEPGATFLPGGPAFDNIVLCGLWTGSKLVIAVAGRAAQRVAMVAKASDKKKVSPFLRNEAAALQAIAGRVAAPALLGQGELRGEDDEARPLTIFCQSWISGVPLSGLRWEVEPVLRQLEQYLMPLVYPDRTASLAQLRDRLALEAEAIWIDPQPREKIFSILATINDTTPVNLSRIHGDFKPQNVLVGSSGSYGVVDWEYSREEGLGVTDLIRFVLDKRYAAATSFADFVNEHTLASLRSIQAGGMPGAQLPLGQLLALQFAMHYLDRIRIKTRGRGLRMKTLSQLVASDWCLAEL